MARFVKEVGRNYNQFTPEDGPGSGSVTSVALSAPTGFTVSGSPITTSGTLALSFTTGYGIPPLMTGNSGRFLTTNGTTMSWVNIAGTDVTGAALTSTNDTNVQITLGGTPSTALLRAASLTMGWTGQLAVGRGGTGASTLTGVVIGNGTSAVTAVVGTAGQFLRRNTANTAYEFRTLQGGDIAGSELTKTDDTNVTLSLGGTPASALLQPVSITLGWTGQLAVGRGGTGASTLTGVLIGNGTSAVTAVSGTSGQLLRRNVANTAYEFFTASLISGNGVADRVAKWTSATNLIDSQIIDDGTNVGIGLTASWKLQVAPVNVYSALNTGDGFAIYNPSLSGANLILGVNGSGTSQGALIQGRSGTASTFAIQLQPYGGNVGIGVNPAHKLDVNGNVNVTGTIYAGNTSATNGSIMMQDNYSSGHLGNIGTMYSGGNLMMGYGVSPSTSSATGFLSSVFITGTPLPRSAIVAGEDIFFYTASAQSIAISSAVSMTERLKVFNNGQLKLAAYTSTSSFTGIVQGYLAFTSGGLIITTATPGGVSGTQNYLAKFDSTGIAVGNSRIVDDGTNFLLNGASSVVTGLNLVGGISATESTGAATILRRSAVPNSADPLGIIDGWGITTGSTYVWGGGIEIRASQNWNSTSAGTEIAIALAPDNTTTANDMFVFQNNGSVRFIGRTSNPLGVAAGTMYYNSSANNMRYYDGTSWITF